MWVNGINEKNDFFILLTHFPYYIVFFCEKNAFFYEIIFFYYKMISFMAMSVSSVGICGRSWKGKAMPIL